MSRLALVWMLALWSGCKGSSSQGASSVTDESCRSRPQCQRLGLCHADGPACVASGDDCAQSDVCRLSAECNAFGGVCGVANDEACRAAAGCRTDGRCTMRDHVCVAASEADCRASETCKMIGFCRPDAEKVACVVGTNEDCAATDSCRSLGFCTARGGKCQLTSTDDCRKMDACAEHGRCTLVTGDGDPYCGVATEADCKLSVDCKKDHHCKPAPERNGTVVGGNCI